MTTQEQTRAELLAAADESGALSRRGRVRPRATRMAAVPNMPPPDLPSEFAA